jgi:hypothetical protein
MATYKNNGGELVFPSLFDADGNVLVVASGATFEAIEGLVIDGVENVSVVSSVKSDVVSPSVDAVIPVEPVVDPVADPAPVETPVEGTK